MSVLTGPESGTSAAGAEDPSDVALGEGVAAVTMAEDGDLVGCGHEASALPSRAACTPQSVTGTVAPVPGLPGLPGGRRGRARSRAGTVGGAVKGQPKWRRRRPERRPGWTLSPSSSQTWVGSHELLALPSTATRMLQAFTGITPCTGALWLASRWADHAVSGNPASGMHMPLDEPSTSTIAPHAVTGTKTSAASPCCVVGSGCHGQLDELLPSISAITSQTVTGTAASTIPVFCDGPARSGGIAIAPRVPDESDIHRTDGDGARPRRFAPPLRR